MTTDGILCWCDANLDLEYSIPFRTLGLWCGKYVLYRSGTVVLQCSC